MEVPMGKENAASIDYPTAQAPASKALMNDIESYPERGDDVLGKERGATARFSQWESFLRWERFPMCGSSRDKRFAVRLGGNSTKSRSWSW